MVRFLFLVASLGFVVAGLASLFSGERQLAAACGGLVVLFLLLAAVTRHTSTSEGQPDVPVQSRP